VELDWTTFILEIINFLVLVWILRRFLYRPVMNVVAQRRAAISQSLQEAQTTQDQATALKAQYENRLADWQREREAARLQLHDEIETERQRLMAGVEEELAEQRHKEQVLAERRDDNRLREARQQAQALSEQFAAKLLSRLAGTAVEEQLLEMLLEDLARLPEEKRKTLAAALPLACRAKATTDRRAATGLGDNRQVQLSRRPQAAGRREYSYRFALSAGQSQRRVAVLRRCPPS
jgi:F-type H+-transporting ATPase subunit b